MAAAETSGDTGRTPCGQKAAHHALGGYANLLTYGEPFALEDGEGAISGGSLAAVGRPSTVLEELVTFWGL